jgi:hypothetical protein
VPVTQAAKERCPALTALRCDPGCHRPAHQAARAGVVDRPVRPRQGRRSVAAKARESEPECVRRRHPPAAVESAINALAPHGLDRGPDHGRDGFKRYVARAVLARNVQRLGAVRKAPAALTAKRRRGPYRTAA